MEGVKLLKLHDWQKECLDLWANNGFKGIINAVTGSGKTFLALSAIKRLEIVSYRHLKIKIVVPQKFLAKQWIEEIRKQLGVKRKDIGVYSGDKKNLGRKYTIYVINSARYTLAKHILDDLKNNFAVFLIADECHHYGSSENNRIFDFVRFISKESTYYALGLSATPEIADFNKISAPLGNEVYSYNLERAIRDKIISQFILFKINVSLNSVENEEYDALSDSLGKNLFALKKERPELNISSKDRFFLNLQRIAKEGNEVSELAKNTMNLMFMRRTLSHMASERPACTISIINSLPNKTRIILFCERIKSAEMLYSSLNAQYLDEVGLYHSNMVDFTRREMLEKYRYGHFRLLICCKALDEGLNIPSTDVGIIVSTSLNARQRIQRMGRILRKSDDIKRIYFLSVVQSNEDMELSFGLNTLGNAVPIIECFYKNGTINVLGKYQNLQKKVLDSFDIKESSSDMLRLLKKNINTALVRGDFLLSEDICREHINTSKSKNEKNYWITVLHMVRLCA